MTEYANGADGSCQSCGEETAEPWHAYCPDCYRDAQGWDEPGYGGQPRRPDPEELQLAHEQRVLSVNLRLAERMNDLERRVATLEREREGRAA